MVREAVGSLSAESVEEDRTRLTRATILLISIAVSVAFLLGSITQLGFSAIADLKLDVPTSERAAALGATVLLREVAGILAALLAAFFYFRRGAHEWITGGLLLVAVGVGFAIASESIEDYRASQFLIEVGRVFVMVSGLAFLNGLSLERQRGKINAFVFFCTGISGIVSSIVGGQILLNAGTSAAFDSWLLRLLFLVFVGAAFYAFLSSSVKVRGRQSTKKRRSKTHRSPIAKDRQTGFGLDWAFSRLGRSRPLSLPLFWFCGCWKTRNPGLLFPTSL